MIIITQQMYIAKKELQIPKKWYMLKKGKKNPAGNQQDLV